MATPVTAFLAWYDSLPKSQRQSLALVAAGFIPGLEEVDSAGLDDTQLSVTLDAAESPARSAQAAVAEWASPSILRRRAIFLDAR